MHLIVKNWTLIFWRIQGLLDEITKFQGGVFFVVVVFFLLKYVSSKLLDFLSHLTHIQLPRNPKCNNSSSCVYMFYQAYKCSECLCLCE